MRCPITGRLVGAPVCCPAVVSPQQCTSLVDVMAQVWCFPLPTPIDPVATASHFSPGSSAGGSSAPSPQQSISPFIAIAQVCSALADTALKPPAQLVGVMVGVMDGDGEIDELGDGVMLGLGDGDVDAEGEEEVEGVADVLGDGVCEGLIDGDGVGVALGELELEAEELGELDMLGVTDGEADGVILGDMVGDGVGVELIEGLVLRVGDMVDEGV